MKLNINETKLKLLLTEATFQDVFNKIKNGDMMILKTGSNVYKSKIISKFSNQLTFEWDGEYYVITNNSFDGSKLTTNRLVIGDDNKTKRTVKGPTIKGVYSIVVKRGETIIGGVTPNVGRPKKQNDSQKKTQNDFTKRRDEINDVFKNVTVGGTITITSGKLITKGIDKGELKKNTITTLSLEYKGVTGKWKKFTLTDFKGFESDKYDKYDKSYFFFDAGSIQMTNEGIILIPVVKNLNDKSTTKLKIDNVFGVDHTNVSSEESEYTMDDILKSPALKNMMLKKPNLLNRILGRTKSTGIVPLSKKLSSLGFNTNIGSDNTNKRVKFKYSGVDIRPDYRFNFKDDKTYIGKFTKEKVIKRTADNRRESMYIILSNKNDDGTYNVTIDFVKLVNNEPQRENVGRGKINIIEINK